MSQHPSLRLTDVGKQHRNVLKRHERIKKLAEEGRWRNGDPVFRLPKVKSLKIKVKKKGEAGPKPAEAAAGVPAAIPAQPAAPPKAAPSEKGAKKK